MNILPLLATIFGIGLVLFVHETGHYLAARMAGVRVEVFSIGMGPRIFGWRWHDCDFRLSLVPFGAYVKMAGEDMTREPLPDELGAQPPRWRFLIYSGGILMNFLFALILIPILFHFGVPFIAPVAGTIEPGGPAWQAGIQEGDRILSIDEAPTYGYMNVASTVALSSKDRPLQIALLNHEGQPREVQLHPEFDEEQGFRRAGIRPPLDSELEVRVAEDSPVWQAGLRNGDRLLAIDGVQLRSTFVAGVMISRAMSATTEVTIRYLQEEEEKTLTLSPIAAEADAKPQLGIRLLFNRVKEIRAGALADLLQPGDEILRAGIIEVSRLEDLLAAALMADGLPELEIWRGQERVFLPAQPQIKAREIAGNLWLGRHEEMHIGAREGGPAAAAGIQQGDILLRVNDVVVHEIKEVANAVTNSAGRPLDLIIRRPGESEPRTVTVTPRAFPQQSLNMTMYFQDDIVKRDNFLDALVLGFQEAKRMVNEVFLTLGRMITGQVDSKNLGGIITISRITYDRANAGLTQLLFFLCMISVHLGVLNLLPIPALDGGHLLFVIIEKLRGRPLSERTQGLFNLVGVAAVLSLIFFTLWQDIRRMLE